jgi:hypothetical protein
LVDGGMIVPMIWQDVIVHGYWLVDADRKLTIKPG